MDQVNAKQEKRLESWKEIEAYLKRDFRTLRRWEKEEGLPIHRHTHKSRSSVYAYPGEIDAWRASRKLAPEPVAPRPLWKIPAFALAILLCLVMVGNGIRPQPVSAQQISKGPVIRQIWSDKGAGGNPSSSPDGRYLSFVEPSTGDLAIRDLKTGTNRHLTNAGSQEKALGGVQNSVISADSRDVVYSWLDYKTYGTELRVLPLDARAATPKTIGRYPSYVSPLSWTPDKRHLLVMNTLPDQSMQLGMVSVQDGSLKVLKSFGWGALDSAQLSPDGRYIAYTAATKSQEDWDIFVLAADGSRESEFFAGSAANNFMALWSPDGSQLVFCSDRTGGSLSLWRVPVREGIAAGPAAMVRADTGWIRPRGITQSGALYYQTDFLGNRNVYMEELDTGMKPATPAEIATQRFLNSTSAGSWSPDGEYLAYYAFNPPPIATRMGTGLVIRTMNTGEERQVSMRHLRVPPYGMAAPPRWFPDGRSVLVVSYGQRGFEYHRVDIATGNSELLRKNNSTQSVLFSRPDLSPDGKAIFYLDGESFTLTRYDLETRHAQELMHFTPNSNPLIVSISPDNRQLAYAHVDESAHSASLEVIPATGGDSRVLYRADHWYGGGAVTSLSWTPDGRSLIFARPEPGNADGPEQLWRIPVAGGEPERIGRPAGLLTPEIFFAQIRPGGRRLAFGSRQIAAAELWALENFLPKPDAK